MRKLLVSLFPAACAVWLAGCGTDAHYVNASGNQVVTTVGEVNIQDFANAADAMTRSLIDREINTGDLRSGAPGDKALLAISLIKNETGEQFDTDLLVKKIRVALLQTGKVYATTTGGFGGPEDPLAAANQSNSRRPDYTLSGKIIESRTQSGNLRQSAFVFQLSLTSAANGIAVWEDEKTIVKQGTRPAVGF
ncbi:MAG TPA: penicillin-binding protein activator LpoB [Verrucomicrobiae bacterium]|nr:penicillin-binding protein activator LpoB [Verrucomicrobiae bacterium]